MSHSQIVRWIPFPAVSLLLFLTANLCAEPAACKKSYIVKGVSLIPECYHPSVVALPDGALVCAWSEGSGALALDTSIKFSRRASGGGTWFPPQRAADDTGYVDNHPVLVQLPDFRLRIIYSTLYREKRKAPPGEDLDAWHLKYADSPDSGRGWGDDFFLIPQSDLIAAGQALRTSNGKLILPLVDIRGGSSRLLISEDQGSYWYELPRPDGFAELRCDGLVENGRDGLLALLSPLAECGRDKNIWLAKSPDRGLSWSAPVRSELNNPGSSIAVLRLENGHLLAAFNDHQLWRTPLTVAVSFDNGRSWPHKRNIESGQWDNRDPSLAQTVDGLVHLVYVSRNIYLKHVEFTESWLLEDH